MHFWQVSSCKPASCWEKTADKHSFLWSYKFVKLHRVWLTDRSPLQSTDASDMTGPAMSSLAVLAWLDQVIASMKDWVLLSTWHIHFTHLSLLNSQTLAAPLLSASSEGNPGLKASFPRPSLHPSRCGASYRFSAPRKLVALQGFPSIFRELLSLDVFPMSVGEPQVGQSHHCLLPVAGWFPPTGSSPLLKPSPLRMENEVLVKINLPSPLHQHLRHHAEKTTSSNANWAGWGDDESFIHRSPLFSWCSRLGMYPGDDSEKLFYIVTA